MMFAVDGPAASIACIVAGSYCAFMLMVQIGHDAAHGSLSPRPWVNRATVFGTFALLGIDGALWRERHIRLHHQVVNLPGTSIDADSSRLLRLMPSHPWQRWHSLQTIYGPLLYAFGHFSLAWIEDIAEFPRACRRAVAFIVGKALHLAVFVFLPALCLRPSLCGLVAGYLLASATIAAAFVLLVVGTHVSDLAAFPQARDGQLSTDWATHQLLTSVDWSPTSHLAAAWTGGANAHVAHHLFPGYAHRHLPALSAVIVEAARMHRLPHHATTFAGMVASHWRHLVSLSRPSFGPESR
jgi:linoleoyl-CoA desaturase